jgi:SAM-dependent methyltransferase
MNGSPYKIEERVQTFHWWFVVRRKLLKTILCSLNLQRESLTMDIGCGVGSNLSLLKAIGLKAMGCDRSFDNLLLAKNKFFLPFINGDLENLPIRSSSVELVIATDVLEHLEDDIAGVRELCRILRRNGYLIVTVPAFQFLWGTQDIVTGHKKRYSKRGISNVLKQNGFQIMRSSYFNFFLFFPILFARRVVHLLGLQLHSENEINFPLLNFFLKTIFSLEPYLLKYLTFPFGVSIFCVAKKQ